MYQTLGYCGLCTKEKPGPYTPGSMHHHPLLLVAGRSAASLFNWCSVGWVNPQHFCEALSRHDLCWWVVGHAPETGTHRLWWAPRAAPALLEQPHSPVQFLRPSSPSPLPFHHGPGRQLPSVLPSPDCLMPSSRHFQRPAAGRRRMSA